MLARGEDGEPYDFPLAEVSPRGRRLRGGHEAIGRRTLCHRSGKGERRALPLREALGGVRRMEQLQALNGQQGLPPTVAACLDAPAAAAQLGRQLAHEKLEASVERLGAARQTGKPQIGLEEERAGWRRDRAAEQASRQTGKPGAQVGLRSFRPMGITTVP